MDRIKRIDNMRTCSVQILDDLLAFVDEPRPAYYGRVMEHWQNMHRHIDYMKRAETTKLEPSITP